MTRRTTSHADRIYHCLVNREPQHIVVLGGSGGIGSALIRALLERFPEARLSASHHASDPVIVSERVQWQRLDIREPEAMRTWAEDFEKVDWLVNCAGFLHGTSGGPEKTVQTVDPEFLIENIRINAMPTLLAAQSFSAALKQSQAPILATVSARVGSIEDNRLGGWYSYRISKAALNMALKTLSNEWRFSHPRGCVAALHPGTNDTALSKPFQRNVAPQNLFDPADTAESFIDLLSRLGPEQSGNFWAWDGEQLPW